MQLSELLTIGRTCSQAHIENKKCALELIAGSLATDSEELACDTLFSAYIARERLGSTGIGHGVAIPHVRAAGVKQPAGYFLQLANPIDFESEDKTPVDLIFAIVAPEEAHKEHLQILAKIAKLFSDAQTREQLRRCQDNTALFMQLTEFMKKIS